MAKVVDNSDEYNKRLQEAIQKAFVEIGMVAMGYASAEAPVDTGNLRSSIAYATKEREVIIGTNVEYAPYIEFGTGVHAEGGGGRSTPWYYQDSKGEWHKTTGMKPQPFLRPAIENHLSEYEDILRDELGNVGN